MAKKSFDRATKLAAVTAVLEEEVSVSQVSQELDVHENTLYRWMQEVKVHGELAFPGKGSSFCDAENTIKKLEQENAYLKEELALLKRATNILDEKQEVRFQFLKKHRQDFNISRACKTLNISKSGFYEFLKRKPSKREQENQQLKEKIEDIFYEHRERYGAVRITRVLQEQGISVNRKRVGKLLQELGLHAKGSSHKERYYAQGTAAVSAKNLLDQTFKVMRRNQVWLGDITYVQTNRGTLYLSVFLDLFTRKIVGWAMDTRMKDQLVTDAFMQAIAREHPKAGLIVHTDHGYLYTGVEFQSLLSEQQALSSMSRKGNPYDNAWMESFYRTIKRELINDATSASIEQAQLEIFKYIETYYNTNRLHSALGYQSPKDFERLHS